MRVSQMKSFFFILHCLVKIGVTKVYEVYGSTKKRGWEQWRSRQFYFFTYKFIFYSFPHFKVFIWLTIILCRSLIYIKAEYINCVLIVIKFGFIN